MKRIIFILSGVVVAFIASVGINATSIPQDVYVEEGTHSCVVSWNDDDNSAWNLRYRLHSEESEDPVLLHSLTGSSYTGNYADITLPSPWGGVNVRGGNGAIYVKHNYNGNAQGYITYTIPAGYTNATFTLMITSGSGEYGSGNFTVSSTQTGAVGHQFSGGETYNWTVTASSGEQIIVTSTDNNYSPDIALIAVYYVPTIEWTYVNNLDKTTYTIEGLELDTEYEVEVQAIGNDGTLSDWTRPNVFFTLAEEPIITSVHILGDINDNQAWSPFAGTKMEYDPETELYTATILVWAGATFGFTTEIDDNEDMGAWQYVNQFRFGPANDDGCLELTEEYMGQQLPLAFVDGFADIQVLSDGFYEVTVSLEQNYVKIGKAGELPHGYARGDINHDTLINISDVIALISILTGNPMNNACEICADVNGDDAVNITDATTLINTLSNGN
jgi:hypothetical protein